MPLFRKRDLFRAWIKTRPTKRSREPISSQDDSDEREDHGTTLLTPGTWIGYRDGEGRPFWQHQETGEWTYDLQQPQQHDQEHQQPVPHQLIPTPLLPVHPAPFPGPHHPHSQQWTWTPQGYQPVPAPWHGGSMVPVPPPFIPSPAQQRVEQGGEGNNDRGTQGQGEFQLVGWGTRMVPVSPPVPIFIPVTPPAKRKEEEKEEEKEEKEGVWERKYDGDGGKFWEHSGTKKRVLQDPYF